MKRVGLRNKIIMQYWNNVSPDDIRRNLGCTQQTVTKWLQPLRDIPLYALPQKLIALGWSPGELVRVLKIDEDQLKSRYGITFKARGTKSITDEQLIELVDSEHGPEEIAEITNKNISHVRSRLREIGWVKPKRT